MRRFLSRCAIGAAVVSPFASQVFAQSVANSVVSFNPVNVPLHLSGLPYDVSAGAIGLPSDTSFGDLTPFNSAFDRNHIVGFGDGGSLIVHMSQPVRTNGITLGVHAAVGIIDIDYPNGVTSNPVVPFTGPRTANLSVSQDGVTWKTLGLIDFDIPTNVYSEGVTMPGGQDTPGTKVANFFQPFTGSLNDFSDKNWQQILTLMNGSGGGKWIDLSGAGLPEVDFVKFEVSGAGSKMYVDSVVGIAVPEPATFLAPILLVLGCRRRK